MNIALIPVKREDMSPICGKSLMYWTIQSVRKCDKINQIYVITDCGDAITELKSGALENIQILYKELGHEQTYIEEAVDEIIKKEKEISHLVYIQRVTPLLRTEDIAQGISLLETEQADSVISVIGRKQTTDIIENGVFYMTKISAYQNAKCFKSGSIANVEMISDSMFEIHEEIDKQVMQLLMKKHGITPEISLTEKAKQVKIFLTDCDGCLTDGGMYYTENGDELKKFNTKDGMGFSFLRQKGIVTGIVTGENVEMVRRRGKKLKLDEVHCGISNKIEVVKAICEKYGCTLEQVAYVGDDINDIEVLKSVGLSCSVANAQEEVKQVVDFVTTRKGGEGAIREVIDRFLR